MKNKTILNGSLKIAVQKEGRLTAKSLELLKGIGLDFSEYTRQLFSKCTNENISILFSRDDDIPELVESGVADLGIVGLDVVLESQVKVNNLLKLDFGGCKMSIAAPKSAGIKSGWDLNGKKVATSFPNITKKYLSENKIEAEVIQLKGGVELAPTLAMSDAIVDLVSSGFTLKVNGLEVIEDILSVQSVLIGANNLPDYKKEIVEKLIFRIKSLINAQNYKYIMMNLPEDKLEDIKKLSPGLKSPTVAPLAKKGWISVQVVITEDDFWETVDQLKKVGAEGIIVMPIEKLII